ncbi:hypothetical protein FJZ48_02975 [Candidatus Uhrbacteria bacterium]|nr:hypothetical protein [Candidatus Uhrbacteria bacterium]
MNERVKRILMIIIFLIIVFGAGYLLYLFFFKSTAPKPPEAGAPIAGQGLPKAAPGQRATSTTPTGPGGLPGSQLAPGQIPSELIPESRTQVLYDKTTRALSLAPNGNARLYDPLDGKFYRVDAQGNTIPLSNQTFYDVQDVDWGKQSDKAILSYPDGTKTLYDFTTDKQVTLPKHWDDFDFSPQDDAIAAKSVGNNESNRFLIVSNPDGTDARAVEELGENQDKVHVSWSPNNQIIAYSFTGDPIGFDRQSVVLLGKNGENFKSLIVEGRGLVPNWSPNGENLLYSVYNASNGYRPELWISGASGDNINANRRNLSIQTWADKCVWQDPDTLFCAVPVGLEEGAGLQREVANDVSDSIYKIDLKAGQKINLGIPDGAPTIDKLIVAPDGKSVMYTDRNTGKLMKYAL